jgi:hypothetical protein
MTERSTNVDGLRKALRKGRWPIAAGLAALAASLVASMALGDNIRNDITASDNTVTVTAGGAGATVKYGIQATGAMSLCDAADGSPVTVTPIVPTGITKSPLSVQFNSCPAAAAGQAVTFTAAASVAEGNYPIAVTWTDSSGSYNEAPAAFTLHVSSPPPPADTTAPVITPNVVGAQGLDGWYIGDVDVSWTVIDGESTITSKSAACDLTTTIDFDTVGTSVTCEATSAGGTASRTVTIKRDATPPTVNASVSPATVVQGGTATATATATDGTSGVLAGSISCDTPDTGSIGAHTVTCTATDNAGNVGTGTADYSVIYDFDGFFQPIDNLPTVNTVKAGSSVPVKFSLNGDQGLSIFAAGSPSSKVMSCSTTATNDPVEETSTAGNSSLQYDALADQYVYVWKTDKSWAKTCRQLTVKLADGTTHSANFSFK